MNKFKQAKTLLRFFLKKRKEGCREKEREPITCSTRNSIDLVALSPTFTSTNTPLHEHESCKHEKASVPQVIRKKRQKRQENMHKKRYILW